jgi:hypothetical protein
MSFCARATRGLTHRRRLRLRLRLGNEQSDRLYTQPLTSTSAFTFRWDVRSRGQARPSPQKESISLKFRL